jgi:hypothetical protein
LRLVSNSQGTSIHTTAPKQVCHSALFFLRL